MNASIRHAALLATLALASHAAAQPGPPLTDGGYDTSWGNGGRESLVLGPGNWDNQRGVAVQNGGKLVLAGSCMGANVIALCATRLLPDGSMDTTFGEIGNGRVLLSGDPRFPRDSYLGFNGFALQADGRPVMATYSFLGSDSSAPSYEGRLIRLSSDGAPQPFGDGSIYKPVVFADNVPPSAMNNAPQAVVVAPDGKIAVAGYASRAGQPYSNLDWGIARFNADLSPDMSFNSSGRRLVSFDIGGDFGDSAQAIVVQADRKIVVAGSATTGGSQFSPLASAAVVRLNADGNVDTGFGSNGRLLFGAATDVSAVNAIALDAQGRILLAGSITRASVASQPIDFFVARVTANGRLDEDFGMGGVFYANFGFSSPAREMAFALALQGDKIIAAGSATTSYSEFGGYGDEVFALVRLLADGSPDPDFGDFGHASGVFAPPGAQPSTSVARGMAILGNSLLVSGDYTPYGGFPLFGIAKLRLDMIFRDGFEIRATR